MMMTSKEVSGIVAYPLAIQRPSFLYTWEEVGSEFIS
jgi:hypothetical protein